MGTVTENELGQEVATDGVLSKITMTKSPSFYDDDCLCLMDGNRTVFNLHISTSPYSPGSVIMADAVNDFASLVVQNIPRGAEFELEFATAPVLSALNPDNADSGSEDLILTCTGEFTNSSTIWFGEFAEPTTHVSDTELTTIVKPSLFAPATVPVTVRAGVLSSDPVDFVFNEPPESEPVEEPPVEE